MAVRPVSRSRNVSGKAAQIVKRAAVGTGSVGARTKMPTQSTVRKRKG